jgi:hypothetical protein
MIGTIDLFEFRHDFTINFYILLIYNNKFIMGYKLHHQKTFWRDTQIGGGTNSYYVAGAILAVVLLLLIIAVYWCRGRNT